MVAPQPPPSTQADPVMFERVTQAGRKLFYRLEVIQQPERARACGSGPKSSADRRPVDPPPVVELRIFEGGSTLESSKDVTFLYNANFFLFATLEHARVTAHCRGQGASANTPPVLTGMPVSGMAYLDRPREAGYFLFPDLSVRHEGRYRLTFNLYEQTKEMNDRDAPPQTNDDDMPEESFDWRMEIKSNDFTVYSAKKFPGLAESTTLSRTVAEQGCRVRIRRDVRMRRRDGKHGGGGGGGGDYEKGEGEYRRRRETQTPEPERARSISHESAHRTPYSAQDAARRMSGHSDIYAPPPPYRGSQPVGGHLSFGSHAASHCAPPPFAGPHNPHPSSVPASPSFGPSHAAPYGPQQSYPSPAQSHPYSERPPTSHYGSVNPSPKSESYPHDPRRYSTSNYPSRPTPRNSIGGGDDDGPIVVDPAFELPPIATKPSSSTPLLRSIAPAPTLEPQARPHPGQPQLSPAQLAPVSIAQAPRLPPPQFALGKRSLDEFNDHAWHQDYAQKKLAASQPPSSTSMAGYEPDGYWDLHYTTRDGHSKSGADRGFFSLDRYVDAHREGRDWRRM